MHPFYHRHFWKEKKQTSKSRFKSHRDSVTQTVSRCHRKKEQIEYAPENAIKISLDSKNKAGKRTGNNDFIFLGLFKKNIASFFFFLATAHTHTQHKALNAVGTEKYNGKEIGVQEITSRTQQKSQSVRERKRVM